MAGLERDVILQGRPPNLSREMCPGNILEKVGSRSSTRGDLSDFCRVLKGRSFCKSGPELSQEVCPRNILEKLGSRSNTWEVLFDLCQVLKGRSFCKAGPETCHKKYAQETFLEKWGAGPPPGGTYLIFAGSCKGGHFASQVQKPVTRNVPKEHFGKSEEQVPHPGGLI